MSSGKTWRVDVYETERGQKPAWSFMRTLEGRNRVEAIALVKLLEERGIGLLDGEIKKRDDIPRKTLERVRGYQREVARRGLGRRPGGKRR